MPAQLRLLVLEDDPLDAELAVALLKEAGFDCIWDRVENQADFLCHLQHHGYDLVLADYNLPSFDGLSALHLLRQHYLDTPFILTSGIIGEETVVESLKAGVTDYVLKDHLARLPLVVGRALQEQKEYQQRQRAEEALRWAERRYRELFENAHDLFYTHDLNGCLISVNRTFERLTGHSRDEVVGCFIDTIVAPEYRPFWNAEQLSVDPMPLRELDLLCSDGTRLPVEVTLRPICECGRAVAVHGSARDISERRRAEEQRRRLEAQILQSQKLEIVGRLAGGIAHDFNNILAAIIGNTQLALEFLAPDDPHAEFLREIEKYSGHATALTSQLLAFSRRQRLARTRVNLNALITNLLRMLKRLIGREIEIVADLGADVPLIDADESQIEQVIMNLAVNARDAMPLGGRLLMKTDSIMLDEAACQDRLWTRPGLYCQLAVCDHGVGMDAETLQHIFEPFFTTKKEGKGTGLGLAVVYGIIKQHNGGIQVTSLPGQGTTFTIYLPALPPVPPPESAD